MGKQQTSTARTSRSTVKADTPKADTKLVDSLEVPEWLRDSELDVSSRELMQVDMRQALEARLGSIFTLRDGVVRTQDGRRFELVVHADRIDVME